MTPWWRGIAEDFSDFPDLSEALRVGVRLLIAVALGGLLGYERERAGKAAGLRTHMLVALGAAVFIVVPQQMGIPPGDLSRVIEGVATGIGFIGAGAIIKQAREEDIRGLTTAAGIWLTAAVGMAAGLGREATAIAGAVLALLTLGVLGRVEAALVPRKDNTGR